MTSNAKVTTVNGKETITLSEEDLIKASFQGKCILIAVLKKILPRTPGGKCRWVLIFDTGTIQSIS
jgi:hypothetical protein